MGLLTVRAEGVYCEQADIYVDPWRPVPRAVVTHAHSDHARRGSGKYLVADEGLTLARLRLGLDAAIDALAYGQTVTLNGVQLALHPAGHMRGSAQVRLEYQGQVAVVTGDFKTEVDPTCQTWEPQRCHQLVIESTFALPIYRWDEPGTVIRELIAWWQSNQAGGKTSVLYCYAIGKAQRILGMLRQREPLPGPIYVHGAIHQGNLAYQASGCALAATHTVRDAPTDTPWNQALILAETMALVLPETHNGNQQPLATWINQRLLPLRNAGEQQQRAEMRLAWQELSPRERFVMHKLITGAFRVGVSARLVTRSLAEFSGLATDVIAHRLMGDWQPTAEFFRALMNPEMGDVELGRPYPFLLAHPLDGQVEQLGSIADWQAEWKWDGIRAQIIRRDGQTFIWSRGEELMLGRFPELEDQAPGLPDGTVLDGEILAWNNDGVLPFAALQKRIGRKKLTSKVLADAPVRFLAFDVLEQDGKDLRDLALDDRRRRLEALLSAVHAANLRLAPIVLADDWQHLASLRETSRSQGTEGIMLKRKASNYGVGRPRGDWWKWKVDPYTLDAVLIYAQRGSGRRASLYTDYTFALWHESKLVPFAKAYSGLSDAEIREVDNYVRQNTLERFGPVRSVQPALVFELAFENIQRSTRHRSGIAVRFPRIVRWRRDKKIDEADRLETALAIVEGDG